MGTEPDAGFDALLTADGVTFDATDAALLHAIDEEGSLNAAAGELGRSYARAHERLGELEAAFGSLVERTRGGRGGGGSRLTDGARDILGQFERLTNAFVGVSETDETVLSGAVGRRTGELASIETSVGPVLALTPPGARHVQVTVRADSVTLHAPDDAPRAGGTSARNRFTGTVERIERGTAVARVDVDLGITTLTALVTVDSLDRLDLVPGAPVVATFKATATRATPVDPRG